MISLLLMTWWFVSAIDGQFLSTEPGSCARTCNSDQVLTKGIETGHKKYPCSCSSSCVLYRDCCYDSHYREKDYKRLDINRMCLSLDKQGTFLAVSSCPRNWTGSADFCLSGLGHLMPVTSRKTGTTYTNIYCALCNGDVDSLTDWNAQVKCKSYNHKRENCGKHFTYFSDFLWTFEKSETNANDLLCQCKYFLYDGQEKSLNKLEIRNCDQKEVSTCSSSWSDNTIYNLCKSYLDPVYVREKVYRNRHCALCNYEHAENLHCVPLVVENLRASGLYEETIRNYCKSHKLKSCLHYLSKGRGRLYSFSELFAIYERRCIPSLGERCCDGYRFDFKRKRCRKLAQ